MRLNIVTVNSGWILQKIAERLHAHLPDHIEGIVTTTPQMGYDAYFYCDIQNCYHNYKRIMPRATHVGYMTHADKDCHNWMRNMFDAQGAWDLDGIKFMGARYDKMAQDLGYEGKRAIVVPPVSDEDFKLRKVHLVIANRGGYPGYGHDFMFHLPETPPDCPQSGHDYWREFLKHYYRFTFVGNGWEEVVDQYKHLKIEVDHKRDGDIIYPDAYIQAYRSADYVLLPLLWAGGPICALEAGLAGVPLIASDVGLIGHEIQPKHKFEPGNARALLFILSNIVTERIDRRHHVQKLTGDWNRYASCVTQFVESCRK